MQKRRPCPSPTAAPRADPASSPAPARAPFGADRWGAGEDGARAILRAGLEAGGNLADTADVPAGGAGEARAGRRLARAGAGAGPRGAVVPATEFGFTAGANPFADTTFTERDWAGPDVRLAVADEAGHPPAPVALAWVRARPGGIAPLAGASRPERLRDALAAADLRLPSAASSSGAPRAGSASSSTTGRAMGRPRTSEATAATPGGRSPRRR